MGCVFPFVSKRSGSAGDVAQKGREMTAGMGDDKEGEMLLRKSLFLVRSSVGERGMGGRASVDCTEQCARLVQGSDSERLPIARRYPLTYAPSLAVPAVLPGSPR